LMIADQSTAWLARLKPLMGAAIVLGVTSIWPLVAGLDEVLRFASVALSQDLLPKIAGGVERHGAPPGAHALASLATLWPWSWVLPFAALLAWKRRTDPTVRFCLAWILPFWLILELTPTKLPHYSLPLFPAIAVLIALTLTKKYNFSPARVLATGLAGLALLGGIATTTIAMLGDKVPRWAELHVSRTLAAAVARHGGDSGPILLVGYHEPSAVFLLGTSTLLANPQLAADTLATNSDSIAAIAQSDLAGIENALTAAKRKIVRLEEIPGYNYSRGEAVTLVVVKSIPSAEQ
jgi:hypothetical protein